ncbi:hypothetical protein Ddye_005281 [Dipteronia dyeriana]|uniref:MULE transposase domain-containing protein n=1 Tax=Dipteronia dyeriana TaxID=168575 RepID=A0AAD9XGT1_9ROSI|nr:hypothetical protein Ddye_005281 [Dipteronia dyeriana]
MDIGQIIMKHIFRGGHLSKGPLPFPCHITHFCEQARINVHGGGWTMFPLMTDIGKRVYNDLAEYIGGRLLTDLSDEDKLENNPDDLDYNVKGNNLENTNGMFSNGAGHLDLNNEGLSRDNLVQPVDDLLHSELISLQDNDIIGKEFISVNDVEEFYKKYSYVIGFNMHKDRLLADETVDTYTWILQTFIEAMHDKCQILVVTNGDKAMSKAIMLVMGTAVHRFCSCHLEWNLQNNVGNTKFAKAFNHFMFIYMTESEFKTQWLKAIETLGLQQNEWVKMLYSR